MSISDFNRNQPLSDLFPSDWSNVLKDSFDYIAFRNLSHFQHEVSKLKQKQDTNCGMSYQDALQKLLKLESDFPEKEQESIRNLVRSNLHKRGLITEEIYEAFRYSTDGTKVDVDVGKYAAGEADCVITPERQYVDFFYELYISVSYPYTVSNADVRKNCAKLLATIEELERKHIFIKIVLVLPVSHPMIEVKDKKYFMSSIPLFSHKDPKTVNTMSAVINDRLLRKFYFAILEELYKDNLASHYGYPVSLSTAMNIGNEFNEIEFFEHVVKSVGA